MERKAPSGETSLESTGSNEVGYCIDLTPDLKVGVAMERLLVGSMDVAHDYALLKQHGVTHILNVACGIANLFTDVCKHSQQSDFSWTWQQSLV